MASRSTIARAELTERDHAIITMVNALKLMTGGQIERVFFADRLDGLAPLSIQHRARSRQRVLRRLVNGRLLAEVGRRRVGGAGRGSSGFLYKVDINGQRIAATTATWPRRPLIEYRPTFPHLLAIGDVYVDLIEAGRADEMTLLQFLCEPACWRVYGYQTLKPDAFVQVGFRAQRKKVSAFIEVDRGQEWGAKLSKKITQYIDYYQSGHGAGTVFPRVLILGDRTKYLTGIITARPDYSHLFQVGRPDDVVRLVKTMV